MINIRRSKGEKGSKKPGTHDFRARTVVWLYKILAGNGTDNQACYDL